MTKKLEDILNIPHVEAEEVNSNAETIQQTLELINSIQDLDKINGALPMVDGLGVVGDSELDNIAGKAEKAFDDLMDLGMNVEARFSSRLFEVAGNMLKTALDAKTAKLDKKLKMIDLQIKKLSTDAKNGTITGEAASTEEYIITDRNTLLSKIKNKKQEVNDEKL